MIKLIEEIGAIESGHGELRKFGLTLGVFFAGLALFLLWRRGPALPFGVLSAFFLLSGGCFPAILKPIQKVWMGLALVMGWVMSHVILAILFFAVLTPIAFLTRLAGKKFMGGAFDEELSTYWVERTPETDPERYERQY